MTRTISGSVTTSTDTDDAAGDTDTAPMSDTLTLRDVIDVVPASCRERSTRRGLALVAMDVAIYVGAIVGLVFADAWWLVVPLWLVAGLAVSGMFVLGHDAAHLALTDDNRLNSWIGHVLFLPSLHIYEGWVLGHNRIHHGHTVREGMDFVWHPASPEAYAAMSTFERLRHRIEWSAVGSGAYYMREVWWQKMIRFGNPPAKWADRIRRDRNFMYLVVGTAAIGAALLGGIASGDVIGGLWMIVKLIVVPFVLFSWTIGWTVYVHHVQPDIRWYRRREWTKVRGQLDGTTVLRIPKILDRLFFHSIFVHMPHHVDMRIPCYHLDAATDAIKEAFPGRVIDRKMRLRDYVRGTRVCKLHDFDTGEWLPYSAARGADA